MKLNSDLIARATRMKLIMQYGVGLEGRITFLNPYVLQYLYNFKSCYSLFNEGIDITSATNLGIKVARIPGKVTGNAASCAEMAIYLMLGLLRKQVRFHTNLIISNTSN